MEYFTRLNDLKLLVQQSFQEHTQNNVGYQANGFAELKLQIEEWGKKSLDIGSDLEIAFRNLIQDYLPLFNEVLLLI
jgi:hypothetical protein